LQSVLREALTGYAETHRLSPRQWQVCAHILGCRTSALGGLQMQCDHCHASSTLYHACRDRHCPRCQRQASEAWCTRQRDNVLPVTYHHLVFTLPHDLNPWIEWAPRLCYRLLFETVWATLSAFAADPKRLDGQLGMTAVLHTWGQNLSRHVHLHCLVPVGALSAAGDWHSAKSNYLFPVRALSRHFRGGFVSRLRQALGREECKGLDTPRQYQAMLDTLMSSEWVVYSKPCLTRTVTVVDYLGRYSHRIALTDGRLLPLEGNQVALRYKDYRMGGKPKIMQLSHEELIRRFLLHVLPKGFTRIRHYGFLANRCRVQRLEQVRAAITTRPAISSAEINDATIDSFEGYPCPQCHQGQLRVIAQLEPKRFEGG
ncbi:MAG: IS91 family transposase, partial [Pseudomonadota bacterium]